MSTLPSEVHLIGGAEKGEGEDKPYANFVTSEGKVINLVGDFFSTEGAKGYVHAFKMNQSIGIVVGEKNGSAYAALVDKEGKVSPVNGDGAPKGKGAVLQAAINNSGLAIIVGKDNEAPYAALIDKEGKARAITGDFAPREDAKGELKAVAINDSGTGIIGGHKTEKTNITYWVPYVALIDKNGKARALTGDAMPRDSGGIFSAAINNSGAGIIGGLHINYKPYVALIDKDGKTYPVTGEALPVVSSGAYSGAIYSVAINNSGAAIIGGQNNKALYAALINKDGTTRALNGDASLKDKGSVYAVGINDSGAAIIGGQNNQASYAALVDKDGKVTLISGDEAPKGVGRIAAVAINDAGVGLIGGSQNKDEPYAALVAPDGTANLLANAIFQKKGTISSVNFANLKETNQQPTNQEPTNQQPVKETNQQPTNQEPTNQQPVKETNQQPTNQEPIKETNQEADKETFQKVLDQVNPKSFGFGGAFADSIFALSKVALGSHLNGAGSDPAPDLVADYRETFQPTCKQKAGDFAVWASPLTFYAKGKGDKTFPTFKNRGLGGILGFDYSGLHGQIFGLGLAYTYQNGHGVKDQRKAKTHQELATLYGSWKGGFLSIEGALWGGLSQMKNHRRTLGVFSSESLVKGALLSPHIKIATLLGTGKFSMVPFVAFDWANYWQGSIKERGKSGLNLRAESHRLSLLRSEFGLEFVEKKSLTASILTFKQGISYVNKLPIGNKMIRTRYVESNSTFPIAVSSKSKAHLAALSLSGSFALKNRALPVFSVGYEGEFGSQTFFHALALEFVKEF